ncbi:MAG: Trk system potassium transporter TrkA [Ruminococcaceae bacterium]|nr:Trk system potassium transporter TrkA [Oscillospiraceae bacterium]
MKIILFGCGKIGSTIISTLVSEGHNIVAIDKSQETISEITNIYDIMGICGNGVDCAVMTEAGISSADLFIAVTGSDELNMLSCFLARRMGAQHTIARIRTPEYNDEDLAFLKNELDLSATLNPELLAAHEIFDILHFPSAIKVETFSNRSLKIIDFIIKENSPFKDMSLSQIRQKYQASFLICNVMRNDEVYIPDGNFVLRVGDRIGITATNTEFMKFLKFSSISQKPVKSVMMLGAGKITYYLAKLLIQSGVKVKIIDKDKERCIEFSNMIPEATMIYGDGMNKEVLFEEGLENTDAFIALTGNDEQNILISFTTVDKVQTVIAKVNHHALATTAEKLGLDRVISSKSATASVISRYARALENSKGSNVEKLYKLVDGKAEVLEFNVLNDFKYTAIPLKEMQLKKNILVAGIIRGRKSIIPSGADKIMPGDKVIVVASGIILSDLTDIIA